MARGYNKVFVLGSLFSCCLLIALVVIGCAVLLWEVFPAVLRSQVNQKVTVQEGHATYEQLQNLTLPLWKSFYFFNLTNKEAFEAGYKPVLEEVGPYSYREYRTKKFLEFSADQRFLTYTQTKVFYFDPDASGPGLKESDIICTINIPFIGGAEKVEKSSFERKLFDGFVFAIGVHLYVCQPATALAWNYTDTLIKDFHWAHQLPNPYVNIQVNNSKEDLKPSIIRTGVDDIDLIGQFTQWDGRKGRLDTWKPQDSACNMLNGTEGLFFHPNLKEGENLQAFADDIQRSVDLVYVGKVNHLGVEAFRYKLADHTFLNVSQYPDNACWGPYEKGAKTPQGLFYIGPSQDPEIPVYGSNPHFYGGDSILLECVEGLHPDNASDKVIKIDVEPVTGANIQLQKSIQLNVKVTKYDHIRFLKKIQCVGDKEAYFYPVLWVNEHAELTPEFKQYLEDKGLKEVNLFNTLVPVIFGLLLALGVILLCVSCCMCCCFVRTSRKELDEERRLLVNVSDDSNDSN